MAITHATALGAEVEDVKASAVSWPAILAGGVASAALSLLLLAFGAGMGFSVVSPWPGAGVSASTLGIGAGLYLIVVAMLASSIGGYLAGRLRTRWVGAHTDEVFFRDTAHGFLSWAFATVLGAAVLTAAASQVVSGAVSGAAQGVSTGAAVGAAGGSDPMARTLDTLLRADPAAPRNAEEVAVTRAELGRLLVPAMRPGGEFSTADRSYAAQLVAARTGLSQAEAEKRINEVVAEAKAAADAARKAAAALALWLTASLLIGCFASSLAAIEGGGLRDGTWHRS